QFLGMAALELGKLLTLGLGRGLRCGELLRARRELGGELLTEFGLVGAGGGKRAVTLVLKRDDPRAELGLQRRERALVLAALRFQFGLEGDACRFAALLVSLACGCLFGVERGQPCLEFIALPGMLGGSRCELGFKAGLQLLL